MIRVCHARKLSCCVSLLTLSCKFIYRDMVMMIWKLVLLAVWARTANASPIGRGVDGRGIEDFNGDEVDSSLALGIGVRTD